MSSTAFRYVVSALVAAAALCGCQSVKREYPGLDDHSVWTALVATARTPDYESGEPRDRWTVRTNEVWEDPEGRRIEVYRRLARVVHLPSHAPRREERTWRFRITLDAGAERNPVAHFSNRGWDVPMIVHEEADRYFEGVTELLSAPPPPAGAGLMPFLPDESVDEAEAMPATAPVIEADPEPEPEPVEEPAEEPAPDEVDPALLDILDPG